jgi:hypothetical protein
MAKRNIFKLHYRRFFMVNIPLVDGHGRAVGRGAVPRESLGKLEGIVVPNTQCFVFDSQGDVLIHRRAQKRILPYELVASVGGYLTEEDLRRNESGDLEIDYRAGAARELNEELKPQRRNFSPEELVHLSGLTTALDLKEKVGWNLFLDFYYVKYDVEEHGKFKHDQREIDEVVGFRPIKYMLENGIYQGFGEYSDKIMDEVAKASRKVWRNQFWCYRAVDAMRGIFNRKDTNKAA